MKKVIIPAILCVFYACSGENNPNPRTGFDKYNSLRDVLSSHVSKSIDDVLTYSLLDGKIDNDLAASVVNSGRPLAAPDYSLINQTKSSYSESLSDNQLLVLEEILDQVDKEGFNYPSAQAIVFNSILEGDELEELYLLVAVTDGVYEGLQNANNPIITKAMSSDTKKYICEVLAGTCVTIWSSWGGAIAVGLGICSGGVATVAVSAVTIAVTPLLSKAFKCGDME